MHKKKTFPEKCEKYFPKFPILKTQVLSKFYLYVNQICQNSLSKGTEMSKLITLDPETNKYTSLSTLGVNCSTIKDPLVLSIF